MARDEKRADVVDDELPDFDGDDEERVDAKKQSTNYSTIHATGFRDFF